MKQQELLAILRLLSTPNIGPVSFKKLIAHCGSATAVFKESISNLRQIEGIGSYNLKDLHNSLVYARAEKELEFIDTYGIKYLYIFDDNYPFLLKQCPDAPILLFYKGNINWNAPKTISIVGTREMTAYGKDICERFIEDLAVLKPTIVSGFAYGVDICAHKAAVKNNLQTIACMAHGINHLYPKAHKKYLDQIMQQGGFVTEFWSGVTPERENFVKRNRIIAGLSQATVIVESGKKGGSLITADLAFDYGRDVFAFPGKITDPSSAGCNLLIKSLKASLITSANDLAKGMQWETSLEKKQPVQHQLFIDLNEEEEQIYNYLKKHQKEVLDTIALDCNIPVFKVASILLNLELKGLVSPLPGKRFEIV